MKLFFKVFFKVFFKTLRFILEPFILLWDKVFVSKGIERTTEEQAIIDKKTSADAYVIEPNEIAHFQPIPKIFFFYLL